MQGPPLRDESLKRSGKLLLGCIFALFGAAMVFAAAPGAGPANPWFHPPDPSYFEQGRYVYERNCMICHGTYGRGDGELVQNWPIHPRNFTKAVFKYRSTPYSKLPTNADLERTIRHGVSGTPMPVFSQLRDQDVRAVIEYIKTLAPEWKNPDNYSAPIDLPAAPAWFNDPAVRSEHVLAGRTQFFTTCIPCHGEKADGNGIAAPGLVDSSGQPIHPADLRQPLRSGATLQDAWRTIAVGINGTPMVGFGGALPPERIWDLVAYIESIKVAAP